MEGYKDKLEKLDKKSEELLQASKYLDCLDVMEEALNIRRKIFGEDSDEYYKTSEKLCELCNMLSMIFLQREKFEATMEFLKKAEVLGQNSLELKAITFNNMACYYRRIGKLRTALTYLQQALEIETKVETSPTLADTHLNICAVYSQLGKHNEAKDHIMNSILLLQEEFLLSSLPKKKQSADPSNIQSERSQPPEKTKTIEDRMAVLAIAYHNLGVEYEYLKQFDEAINTYKKAVNFAKNYLAEGNKILENLNNVLATAQQQIDEMKNKTKQRKLGKETIMNSKNSTQTRFGKAKNVYAIKDPYHPRKTFNHPTSNQVNEGTPPKNEGYHQDEEIGESPSFKPEQKGLQNQNESSNNTTKNQDLSSQNQSGMSQIQEEPSNSKKWGNMMTPRNITEHSRESDDKEMRSHNSNTDQLDEAHH